MKYIAIWFPVRFIIQHANDNTLNLQRNESERGTSQSLGRKELRGVMLVSHIGTSPTGPLWGGWREEQGATAGKEDYLTNTIFTVLDLVISDLTKEEIRIKQRKLGYIPIQCFSTWHSQYCKTSKIHISWQVTEKIRKLHSGICMSGTMNQ